MEEKKKIYFIRNYKILEGELIGYTKKGAYRVLFNGKETLVNCLKGFESYEDANKELIKIKKQKEYKEEKEKEMLKKARKELDLIDLEFRAEKSYQRKEITKQERDQIINECEKKIKNYK